MGNVPGRNINDKIYHQLFTEMVDGFVLHEIIRDDHDTPVDYRIIDTNPSFMIMTGRRSENVIGRTLLEAYPLPGPVLLLHFGQVVHTGKPLVFDFYSQEVEKHYKISAFQPEASLLACVLTDITEHKLVEDALRESEAKFRAHVENSFDVIFTLDATGTFVFVSPAWERHFGYPVSEIMGQSFAPFVHPDDVQPCVEYLTRILSTGQSGTSPVYRVKCADGSYRSFVANGMPYIDTKGRLLFIGVGHDVTDQLQAEQDRLDFERQLLHTQKLESLGVLAGGIAHDFNNLLLTILGNIELAALKIPPDSTPHRLLEQATLAANRAADLTSRLLAYSGKGVFVITRFNLNGLVNENATLLRTAVPGTVSIDLHLSARIPDIMGDTAQIQQVVMNLITNAAEAIEIQPGQNHAFHRPAELRHGLPVEEPSGRETGTGKFCLSGSP